MAALRCAGISASLQPEHFRSVLFGGDAFQSMVLLISLSLRDPDRYGNRVAVENWPGEPEAVLNGNAKHADQLAGQDEVAMPATIIPGAKRRPKRDSLAYTSSKWTGPKSPVEPA